MEGWQAPKPSGIFLRIPRPSQVFVSGVLQNHWCHQLLNAAFSGLPQFKQWERFS